MDHRYMRHEVGTLRLEGRAPDDLIVWAGSRAYRNDRILMDPLEELALAREMDEDPWGRSPS